MTLKVWCLFVSTQVTPQIEQLILIDRSVDLITPLATQLTYEGLIHQFFTINNCKTFLIASSYKVPYVRTSLLMFTTT